MKLYALRANHIEQDIREKFQRGMGVPKLFVGQLPPNCGDVWIVCASHYLLWDSGCRSVFSICSIYVNVISNTTSFQHSHLNTPANICTNYKDIVTYIASA